MYLMEGDSIPIKENWLDAIANECQKYGDFAIFGSRYRGDNWADFLNLMPDAMKYHINGNAVYNFNHPKTLELLYKLEDELETEKRATAYDVRIVELLMKENSIENLNKTIYRDSSIFANYAGTYLVEELNLGQEYVAHGFRSRALWPEDVGIDLVISDWGNSQVDTILNDLEKVSHPFKNIYIYSDELNEPKEELSKTGLKIHRIKRNGHHPGEDWCVAPVSSNWLMYTNSYYTVSNIQLQVKKLQGQLFAPILPFMSEGSIECSKHQDCIKSVELAKNINKDYSIHANEMNIVFNRDSRDVFYKFWKNSQVHGAQARLYPSGDEYLAWVLKEKNVEYDFKDILKYGQRLTFIKFFDDDSSIFHRRLTHGLFDPKINNEYNTSDYCARIADQRICEDPESCCHWYDQFQRCGISESRCEQNENVIAYEEKKIPKNIFKSFLRGNLFDHNTPTDSSSHESD